MPQHEQKTCPRCQQHFECKAGSISICGCMTVQLSDEQRELLRREYDDCICVDCLKATSFPTMLWGQAQPLSSEIIGVFDKGEGQEVQDTKP